MSQKRINRSFQPPVNRQLTLTEEVSDRLLLFTGVEITVDDPDSISQVIWGDGIELVNLDRVLPDQIILLPNEEPRRVQDKNLEFLIEADCSVLQVLDVYAGHESYSFSFRVLGQLHADDLPVFEPQQRLFVKIKCGPLMFQMLTVVPISDLAESFRHLGSLDPNKRRRIESSIPDENVLQVANGMLGSLGVANQLGGSSSISNMVENSSSVMSSSVGHAGQFVSSSSVDTSQGLSSGSIGPVPSAYAGVIPPVSVKERIQQCRVSSSTSFRELLDRPLPFKIPITTSEYVNANPNLFELGRSEEYLTSIDTFLDHQLLTFSSEQAVVVLDGMWQIVLKKIADVTIYLDQHDPSSQASYRPDFTATHGDAIVMKGEAKALLNDMNDHRSDLINKFHDGAYRMFPNGWAVQRFQLLNPIRVYDVSALTGRISFIQDLFKLMIWILSQIDPVEKFHLMPGVRMKTRNGHHVTLNGNSLKKEFSRDSLGRISMEIIRKVYELKLRNVEWGVVNGTSVTILRLGHRLRDVFHLRTLDRRGIFEQIELAVNQLHANGFAHCDICVDNIFVEFEEDGGTVFLGDVEYCCAADCSAPTNLKRSNSNTRTAEELDLIQLEKLKDELADL